ncbi:MAG TPA: ABC transporter ATP-binding protein [Ramlibacter sp.]|nr:ABC transporter ATP-binding protein [Ramlibacter sp.]
MLEGEIERSAAHQATGADDRPVVISALNLGKAYTSFASPLQRLRSVLFGRDLSQGQFWALQDFSLEVRKGDVLGVVGQNGAGKSTLLQILCGTLKPTTGSLAVDGRIAALLELGAGFNPDFSGRDNLLLNGPLLGLTREQLHARLDDIVAFSGIGAFIDQPVKTYSSGMFVRLAFSLATSVDPDILVVDEALSVGDGEFARKSFDRILKMKERGTTILFCSHALYQVEAFCTRVVWLDQGKVRAMGSPHTVVREYMLFLAAQAAPGQLSAAAGILETGMREEANQLVARPMEEERPTETPGHARITKVETSIDGVVSDRLSCTSGQGCLRVAIEFESDPELPAPAAGMTFELGSLMILGSVVSKTDGIVLERDANGRGRATIRFDGVPLRKGEYILSAYLGTADALHFYSEAKRVAILTVHDTRPEPGAVDFAHEWELSPGHE